MKKSFGKLTLYGLEQKSPFSINNPYQSVADGGCTKVCEFVFHVCMIQLTKQLPPLLASGPPRKERNHKPAKAQQQTQTNATIITNLDKEGILKTALGQLSPYLSMQPSEMHLKVLTELTGVTVDILSLKDYEDWKKADGTPILKNDGKDNPENAGNSPYLSP